MKLHGPLEPVFVPRGFRFAAAKAGIKASGKPDLALAEAPGEASSAAVFTRNLVAAAPVVVGRDHLRRSRGRLRAVLVNSGNANCGTGPSGLLAARRSCAAVARALGRSGPLDQRVGTGPARVLPSSTGIIGVPLPEGRVAAAVPGLAAGLAAGERALRGFGKAIMTTDLRPKLASASFTAGGRVVSLAGVAKGAGMIHPDMATMLVYLFCDVAASPAALRRRLKAAVDVTFNAMSVDGDTSTNDTVLLMASGASGVRLGSPGADAGLEAALRAVCGSLAAQIIRGGEGARHLVRLRVEGARSVDEARAVARSIANSPLVKTAWAGCDPNWGRILARVGISGVPVDPGRVGIDIGPYRVFEKGRVRAFDRRGAHKVLERPEYVVRVRLGRGRASLEYLTCDLTEEYVRINAEYST